jgi:hypothetical protein
VIVVDASALLELLLRTDAANTVETRLFSGETLHAPHVLDLEVAQVLRRYERSGDLSVQRGGRPWRTSRQSGSSDTRTTSSWRASGRCARMRLRTTRVIWRSPRRSMRRSSPGTTGLQRCPDTGRGSRLSGAEQGNAARRDPS